MKKNFTIAGTLLLLLCSIGSFAQNIKLISDTDNRITVRNVANGYTHDQKTVDGVAYKDFKGTKVFTMQKDAPALPAYRTSVIVPQGGDVSLEISYDGYTDYPNVNILPSKGSLKRNINPADVAYGFGPAYQQDAFYPGNLAEMSTPYTLRDTKGVTVSFYPYQYNPVTKTLRLYNNITINVNSQGGSTHKTGVSSTFNTIYSQYYLNAARTNQAPQVNEMLIIAPEGYMETITPFSQWKNQRGLKTTTVSLEEAGTTPEAIKEYITEYYADNSQLVYVLLVGDHENLPSYTYGFNGSEELWSDSYYGQLEGDDFYPEVLVGRFSGTVQDVAVMVNRTLEYETAPMAGDWVTKAAGIGSNEGDGYGDDGEPDWQHLRNIGTELLDFGYSQIYEFYDGSHGGDDLEEGPSPEMISEAINDGVGLLNYTGHGAQDVFVTGWYTSEHVNALENNGKYPFIISVACNNGTFTNGTSLCESWLNVQHNGTPAGAVAACGSSILMAWAEPMETQDAMTELITASDPESRKTTLGELFYNGQLSMLEAYGLSATAVDVMKTWVFFGDPSVQYRNAPAEAIVAEHLESIQQNAETVTVTSDAEGALISITQNGVIIGTGVIVDGEAVITLTGFEAINGPLIVTATQQNHTPYQGEIAVQTLSTGSFTKTGFAIYPNPAKGHFTVATAIGGSLQIELRDITGKLLYASGQTNAAEHTVSTANYAAGIYLVTVNSSGKTLTQKIIIN
ncbi:T9SS type A sorting domain-containing protein [Flavobacterium zepuense]|uniref:T9SS type A sorting domain-containing protein n=1 Tax=Flavobacterium zepuense TaxID=2593302 RepID=A0A552V2B2_9FLAO|nr:C25 family cysteine peptidase [Flavobacterium zepuense]TRW24600.1 T9SS type A sorting domain-containing protein [Flavobacterium zepuense]